MPDESGNYGKFLGVGSVLWGTTIVVPYFDWFSITMCNRVVGKSEGWKPPLSSNTLLFQNKHFPCGGKIACGQVIEIHAACHLLTEFVTTIPVNRF